MGTMSLKSFGEVLFRNLRDARFAAAYLQDALEESPEEFLIALREYIQANGGLTRAADKAQVSREALHRMLSGKGNPGFRQLSAILRAQGIRMQFVFGDETAAA